MKYRVMLTSLYGGGAHNKVEYYCADDGERRMYCDAILSAEASCKYILANHRIDEIITLGSNLTYDPGDELVEMVLREGSSFYSSNIDELSTYNLLRYRLAQFIEELRIEEQDLRDILDPEEQKAASECIRAFYNERLQPAGEVKFNKLFDAIMQDKALRDELTQYFTDAIPGAKEHTRRYVAWICNYLYDELKETSKLELLEGNENVKIRFIPTGSSSSLEFAETLNNNFMDVEAAAGEPVELELYVCIQSDDAKDTFAINNFIDIVKSMPGNKIKLCKIATGTLAADGFSNIISDDTTLYGVSDLMAGMRAFLQYGRTDILMDYWNRTGRQNSYIERLLYAMRNIDVGISLCDISDIERGIVSLEKLFAEGDFKPDGSIVEGYFDLIIDAIKLDYGVLVSGAESGLIDLVKWAYRKGFWQQTLTFIESRTPEDLVRRGIYYYCDSEESRENVMRIFAEVYNGFKPFERYKMDEPEHYFIKFYGRDRADRASTKDGRQQTYVKVRMQDLDSTDPDIIRACTNCSDREALKSLLYSYYMIGIVRNETNHAETDDNEFKPVLADADLSERMSMIKQCVDSFITNYEKVLAACEGAEGKNVYIASDEIKAYAARIRPQFDKNREHKDYGDRKDGEGAHGAGGEKRHDDNRSGDHHGSGGWHGKDRQHYNDHHSGGYHNDGGYHRNDDHQRNNDKSSDGDHNSNEQNNGENK